MGTVRRIGWMYTFLLSMVIALIVSVVPTIFGVNSTWTILPGIVLGIVAFVWASRRVAKRVEAVTRAADLEMSRAQTVAQRSGAKGPAVMLRAIEAAVARLKMGLFFR